MKYDIADVNGDVIETIDVKVDMFLGVAIVNGLSMKYSIFEQCYPICERIEKKDKFNLWAFKYDPILTREMQCGLIAYDRYADQEYDGLGLYE